MALPHYASLHLARFDRLRPAGPANTEAMPGALFVGLGADSRAAGTDPAAQEAFKFLLLGLHADLASAEHALHASQAVAPWWEQAAETWSAVLQPFRHIGESNYLDRAAGGPLFADMGPPPAADEPIVVVTSIGWRMDAGFDPERVRAVGNGVSAIRAGMTAVPGLHSQQSFFFAGGVEHDPTTVTTWRSFDAMRAWAYGPGVHRMYLDRHKAQAMAERTAFTRCRIVRSRGTWYGGAPEAWAS